MRKVSVVLMLGIMAVSGLGQTLGGLISSADSLFQEVWLSPYSAKGALDLRMKLEEAIDLYSQALALDPANIHVLNMLARSYYTLADVFLPERDKEDAYERGQAYGERSLRAHPEFVAVEKEKGFVEAVATATDVEALYWTYANWGRKVELGGVLGLMGAAVRGDDKKLNALIARCLELDRGYLSGGPLRSLASYYTKHPFHKDYEGARELLLEAMAEYGDYLENQLFYVQYYLMPKELWAEARTVLAGIMDAPIEPYPLYNSFCQETAAKLLAEIQSKH